MSTLAGSRNDIKPVLKDTQTRLPNAPSLADLISQLAVTDLKPARRRAKEGALRAIAKLLKTDPDDLPANLRDLLRRLDQISPAEAGLSRKYLQNLRAELKAAFAVTGWAPRANRSTFTPGWAALSARLPNQHLKGAMTRFMRFCSERNIEPDQVDDVVLAAFLADIEEVDYCRHPRTVHRDVCRIWNRMAEQDKSWPQARVTQPNYSKSWGLRWDQLSPDLAADTEAYLQVLARANPFDDAAPARPAKPLTIHQRRHQVRTWTSALIRQGWDPAALRSLADLVTIPACEAALAFFTDPAKPRGQWHLHGLLSCLRNIAKHWVKVPPDHLRRINRAAQHFRPVRGMTAKNQDLLRQFEVETNLQSLLLLPRRTLARVARRGEPAVTDARKIQLALAVELLLVTALRRANVAALEIGRHLRITPTADGMVVHVVLDEREVKNGQALATQLPAATVDLLQAYLTRYRPLLAGAEGSFLFPGRGPGSKSPHHFSNQVKSFIHREIGLTVTPHLFRHLAGKLMLEANPDAQEAVRQLLGHKSLQTTIQNYLAEDRARQLRRYDAVLERLRSGRTP